MVNFLALLGWSPGSDEELFTRDELVDALRARRHQRRQRGVQPREARLVQPAAHDAAAGRATSRAASSRCSGPPGCGTTRFAATDRAWLERVIELLKPRAKTLGQFVDGRPAVFRGRRRLRPGGRAKHLHAPGSRELLSAVRTALDATAGVRRRRRIEEALRGLAAQRGIKPALPIHMTRVAVTGKTSARVCSRSSSCSGASARSTASRVQ